MASINVESYASLEGIRGNLTEELESKLHRLPPGASDIKVSIASSELVDLDGDGISNDVIGFVDVVLEVPVKWHQNSERTARFAYLIRQDSQGMLETAFLGPDGQLPTPALFTAPDYYDDVESSGYGEIDFPSLVSDYLNIKSLEVYADQPGNEIVIYRAGQRIIRNVLAIFEESRRGS